MAVHHDPRPRPETPMRASTPRLAKPIKYHGGKHYLAPRILALMPPHSHYVEPYAGGLAVLLAKDPRGVSEVVNDLDGRLINFWRVLQGEATFEAFRRRLEATPFSEAEWRDASAWAKAARPLSDAARVDEAARFFIHCRQSLAGRMEDFATLSRTRTRRGMNEQVSAWLTAVDCLPAVHARLRRVVFLSGPAVKVLRSQDGPDTLFYLDPPYLEETRTAPGVYRFEMTRDDHAEMLDVARQLRGSVMISGYPSDLYDSALDGWERHTFDLPNNAASGESKDRETEVVWCNF
jgi:DNA adenine methylase